ncbi:MAG: rod shape-determining protein MreD [Methylococcales bacterium]
MSQISLIVCIIIAMTLKIAPIPHTLIPFNPDWILLVIIAHTLAKPYQFSIGSAWLIGLFTDVLTSKILGQYALAYAVCAYILVTLHRQIRQFSMIHQCILVLLLLLSAKATIYITTSIQGVPRTDWTYWSTTIVGALIWPLIQRFLNKFR